MQIVAVVLLHNEDVFVDRVIRNVAEFCDRIHVADHMSTDDTWEIVSALACEFDHVNVTRIAHAGQSHDLVTPYVGTHTWVINPDGDELYDPNGLSRLRALLAEGRYDRGFRLVPAMLHAVSLAHEPSRTATGYLSPPARSGGKLFNFRAIRSWTHVYRQCLHEGEIDFLPGWDWDSVANLGEEFGWDDNPFRCVHTCFMRRSSRERANGSTRLNPIEAHTHRRDAIGRAQLLVRRLRPRHQGPPWKLEKYRRGPLVTLDASPFFPAPVRQ